MTPEEQKPFNDRAELVPKPIDRLPPPSQVQLHAAHPQSPWGIGSRVYPCAAPTLQHMVHDILPDAKHWVQSAFARCMEMRGPDAVNDYIVHDTRAKLPMKRLLRNSKANQTCFEVHPGLCAMDPDASSIRSFHRSLGQAMKCFAITPGETLFLFTGHRRKRDAERAYSRQDLARLEAEEFQMAFLADRPDRRCMWNTFTLCRCIIDDEHAFHCGTHARLIETESGTFDESVSFAFAGLLRRRCRYWCAHELVYLDVQHEFHTVKVLTCR